MKEEPKKNTDEIIVNKLFIEYAKMNKVLPESLYGKILDLLNQARVDENEYWSNMQNDWIKGGVDEGIMIKNIKMRIIELRQLKEKK